MAVWVSGASIRDQYGLSKAILGQKQKSGCLFIRKLENGRIEVDSSSIEFLEWIPKAVERSAKHRFQIAVSNSDIPETGRNISFVGESVTALNSEPVVQDNDGDLVSRSRDAKLMDPILKNEEQKLKIEQKKIELELAAGNLIEWSLAEFLFIGYCERHCTETLQFPKKLEPKVEHLINDHLIRSPVIETIENESLKELVISILGSLDKKGIAREITKLNIRENEEIIRNVKASQAEDVTNWKKENGIE